MTYWPEDMTVQPIVEWPGALARQRTYSAFSSTLSSTMQLLRRELEQLGAKDVLLQIAIPREKFRKDGKPYADAKPLHPGIILTLNSAYGPLSYPCDTYATWQENLRAIALALEALRKVDRYGVTKRGEQYRGFLAIEGATPMPAGFTSPEQVWTYLAEVADVDVHAAMHGRELLRRAKRAAHPDTGGSAETFQRVTLAEQYLTENGYLK